MLQHKTLQHRIKKDDKFPTAPAKDSHKIGLKLSPSCSARAASGSCEQCDRGDDAPACPSTPRHPHHMSCSCQDLLISAETHPKIRTSSILGAPKLLSPQALREFGAMKQSIQGKAKPHPHLSYKHGRSPCSTESH